MFRLRNTLSSSAARLLGEHRARLLRLAAALAFLASVCFPTHASGELNENASPAVLPHPEYSLPFGTNPYAPSEARAEFAGFLRQADVPNAAWCGHCHQGTYEQWRQSAHANSFRTPWYTRNVNLLIDDHNPAQHGIERSRHCEGCHNPTALFSGMLTPGAPRDTASRPFDAEGVTCMSCHAIRRLQPVRGLGSYVMGIPAAMLDAKGNPQPGLPSDAEIYAHLDRHRAAVMRDVLKEPEFCGSCHKANLPKALNGYKWLRAFTTYDEWQQSGWSRTSPLAFFPKDKASTCQTCHMPAEEATDASAKQGKVASHRWLGANTAIPVEYGYDRQLEKVIQFLRQNALRVDVFALTTESQSGPPHRIAPLDSSPSNLRSGDVATVDIVVQNTGIGHSLVPEQRDMYESWLAVEVRDGLGKLIYESGDLDEKQRLKPDTHSFTNRILGLDTSQDGGRLNHHEVWKVEARSYDSTVMPGRAVVERYRFQVPSDAGAVTITAAVKYRRFRREFLDWVFEDKPAHVDAFPTITMASDSVTIGTAGQSTTKEIAPSGKPALPIRWTAYGIGLMDRQQNREAAAAFAEATILEPKGPQLAWSYTNEAVAHYMDGDWDGALTKLRRALALEPNESNGPANARARYYEGMCLRWQFHWKEAEKQLAPLSSEFPQFRQVHDDLGYIYMVEREYANARREFEAALAIEPDDLTAHKWLGGAYEALGMHEQALAEAAATTEMKDDPQATWRVQSYWRNHLEVAHDVVLDHSHGLLAAGDEKAVEKILNTQSPPSYIWIQQ